MIPNKIARFSSNCSRWTSEAFGGANPNRFLSRQSWERLTQSERRDWFTAACYRRRTETKEGEETRSAKSCSSLVFARFSYDEKLEYCERPENISGPSEDAWGEINTHLGTTAADIPELVEQLSVSGVWPSDTSWRHLQWRRQRPLRSGAHRVRQLRFRPESGGCFA